MGRKTCRTPKDGAAVLVYKVRDRNVLAPATPPTKKAVIGRVTLSDNCDDLTLPSFAEATRVASLVIQPAIPPAEAERTTGNARFKSVAGVLDDLGTTFFIEYAGDAPEPTVLVDGLPVPTVKLEVDTTTTKPKAIVGG